MSHRLRQAGRSGPKLWLSEGNDRWQALAGVEVGQVLSFVSFAAGVPTVSLFKEGNTEQLRQGKWLFQPLGVRDPEHASNGMDSSPP